MGLALVIAFSALLLTTLLALLWSRWPLWLRGLLIGAVTLFYFYANDAIHQIWGVPSRDALPERFVMIAAVVEEPAGRAPGSIYLWVTVPQEGAGPRLEPRAYRVPYSRPLHAQIEEGLRKGREGISQMGSAEAKAGSGRAFGLLRPGNDEQEIRIKDLPVPALPEK